MTAHFGFGFAFSDDLWIWPFLINWFVMCVTSFDKGVSGSCWPVFKSGWMFSCFWVMLISYITCILTLYQLWFANVFSRSIGCLFTLLISVNVSLTLQKFVIWCNPIYCYCYYSAFLACAIGVIIRKSCFSPDQCHWLFPYIFF